LFLDPRERLAAVACATAFKFCAAKVESALVILDSCALKGPEVDWVRQNVRYVDYADLHVFIDKLRCLLWPSSQLSATRPSEIPSQQAVAATTTLDEGELFVAL